MLEYIEYSAISIIIFFITVFILIIVKDKKKKVDYYLITVIYLILFIFFFLVTYYDYSKATNAIESFKSNKTIICIDRWDKNCQENYTVNNKNWNLIENYFINNDGLKIRANDCKESK